MKQLTLLAKFIINIIPKSKQTSSSDNFKCKMHFISEWGLQPIHLIHKGKLKKKFKKIFFEFFMTGKCVKSYIDIFETFPKKQNIFHYNKNMTCKCCCVARWGRGSYDWAQTKHINWSNILISSWAPAETPHCSSYSDIAHSEVFVTLTMIKKGYIRLFVMCLQS